MVEMRCTKWEAGLISKDTSVSLFHCDTSSFHCGASRLSYPTAGDDFAKLILDMRCDFKKLGACWQLRFPLGNITSNRSLPFLSNFFKLPKYSAYVLLHFFLQRPMN